jgi:aminoglycoside/choline kinase family phosphotransferase
VAERLPNDVGAAVEHWVGPVLEVRDRSWPHGVTRVWRITTSSDVFWVKRHTQMRKFLQESRAYTHVIPSLVQQGHRVPQRVAEDRQLRVLLLTDVAGHPAPEEDPLVHVRAGRITRALHTLPLIDEDPVPIHVAIQIRAERWLLEARGVIDEATAARVREEVGDGSAFLGCQRSWCHRDWSPRNWLLDGAGRFCMIDFEHCAPDLPTVDLVKLCYDVWRRHPETEQAFYEGYGHIPDDAERDRLRRLLWLHAISTVAWAAAHDDPSFERHGRGLLVALGEGWRP